ncbi:ADP-ribosylglycohydrolase [Pleomassaria siparia CBS 279.74]|uniref:ADP-ribosylglycohydrolase n=1 Tax=Pleomassaria siparia CBS 279.74 TaxID=1314801 RepID=A0A6G1KJK6_9PLEO|nr:ADP-ribosylglycohydrolase [Pleomassaria siparia CBS 279.74]
MYIARFEKCAWTDDTDQALLIILSCLHNHSDPNHLVKLPRNFAARLRIWIERGLLALDRNPCGIGKLVGDVVEAHNYLKHPKDTAVQKWISTKRKVAPNGSLMRTHPIGVICMGLSEQEAWHVATGVGRTTHVDPRCVVACCISVGVIRGLLRGEILIEEHVDQAIERAYEWVLSQPELMNPGLEPDLTNREIRRHLDREEFDKHVYAETLEELKLDSKYKIGYVYKCLGSAILLLRLGMRAVEEGHVPSPKIFEDLMVDLIMEGGDADTNGAAAGALLGAFLGRAGLPLHWADGLAHRDWMNSKIERLTVVLGITEGHGLLTVATGNHPCRIPDEKDEAPYGGK